jgi:thioesterase domain-containing protein
VSIYQRANQAYVPEAYRGRVVLFKTQGRYHSGYTGWEKLVAGRLETEDLDTDHDNVFKEPYVRVLAEKLRNYINDALDAEAHQCDTPLSYYNEPVSEDRLSTSE